MKTAIITSNPKPINKVTLRTGYVADYLARQLKVPLIQSVRGFGMYKADRYIYVCGVEKFCEYRDYIKEALIKAKQVVLVQNDYKCISSIIRSIKREVILWSTIPDKIIHKKDSYVNVNLMTWYPPPRTSGGQKYDGVLYYGAFREGRVESFNRYFKNSQYQMHISTSQRSFQKFSIINPKARFLKPLKSNQAYGLFQATIYIEDEYSHKHYCSLANRFYECLSNGIAILVDEECQIAFVNAGLKGYEEFVVKDQDDVSRLLLQSANIERKQRALWWDDYPALLNKQIADAYKKL